MVAIVGESFNPCFNGTMYKNGFPHFWPGGENESFNPCFNGTMYKNNIQEVVYWLRYPVSILVLMELCIKT